MPAFDELIFPVAISTPFAVGDVYSYIIKDEKIVLVDCGHKANSAFRQLRNALQKQELGVDDVDEIWLTHGHPDHYGQAARLAKQSNAVVRGHPKERANFAANANRSLFRHFFSTQRIPADLIETMLHQLDWLQQFQTAIEPTWLSGKAILSSGQLTFRVHHTPGHAPGHIVFYDDEGITFGGDVLLEHISTNALINFDARTGTRNKSLLQYRRSLQWIKNRHGVVMPGHGKQIRNIKTVAENHLNEQEDRYQKIKALLAHQPRSLMDLSLAMFPDAMEKDEAYFLVFSEIMGYLDWGIKIGEIEEQNGKFYFTEKKKSAINKNW